jgi:plasmid stabilization system protein ParE
MILRYLPAAEDEIQRAAQWYAEQRPGLGQEFLADLSVALESVEDHPRRWAKVDGISRSREVRVRSLDRFPYAAVYEVRENELALIALAHHHRRPAYWKGRRV